MAAAALVLAAIPALAQQPLTSPSPSSPPPQQQQNTSTSSAAGQNTTTTNNTTNATAGAVVATNITAPATTPHERHQQLVEQHQRQQQQAQAQPQQPLTPPSSPTTTPPPSSPTVGTSTDPELQRFDQIANGCKATIQRLYPGAQTLEDIFLVAPQGATSADYDQMTSCNQLLRQAIAQYCNVLQTYDAAKCAYVNTPETLILIDMTAIIAEQEFLYNMS